MASNIHAYLEETCASLERLGQSGALSATEQAIELLVASLSERRSVLVCGNGGSAADAEHISGELVGRFFLERRGFNVIALTSNAGALTAIGNDYGYDQVFARQVDAFGTQGGVLMGLSTSGNSANVVNAFVKAKELGLSTVAFTGEGGGALAEMADVVVAVPSRSTPIIQQLHQVLYHYLCREVEAQLC